jgi:hypothetical protein
LFFLLIVPLKALATCQSSYWCITGVNNTGNACIASVIDTGEVGDLYCPVSTTPVMHDVTGVVDTELILYQTFYTELFYTKLFYTELILY